MPRGAPPIGGRAAAVSGGGRFPAPGAARLATAKKLEAAWSADEGERSWRKAIETGESRALRFVLAAYRQEHELARLALQRLKSGDSVAAASPYRRATRVRPRVRVRLRAACTVRRP